MGGSLEDFISSHFGSENRYYEGYPGNAFAEDIGGSWNTYARAVQEFNLRDHLKPEAPSRREILAREEDRGPLKPSRYARRAKQKTLYDA